MDLVDFLKKTREHVASLNNFEEVHVVLGNTACDLDSTVSAILHAYYLSKISDEGNRTVIPVLNIPREDYALRTEVVSYLSSHRLEESLLTFENDLDLKTLASEKNLKLTLVDHNVLNQKDSEVLDSLIVEIIDHHENMRNDDVGREINIVIEPVGSCVTLVVGTILEESEDLIDERISMLATGTILLDTVNLSPEAGRTTPKDTEVLDKLRRFCPNVVYQDIFDSLQRAKFDISGLSAMDVLRKDYKSVCGNDQTIGLSSIPCSIEQLIQKLEGGDTLNEFCESRGLSALLLVSFYNKEDESLQRELGIFSTDAVLRSKLETHFSSDSAGLLLEPQSHDCIGLSSFIQGNIKASRKAILPLTQNFLSDQLEVKPDLRENGEGDEEVSDGLLEGNNKSGTSEIKVVETTDLLGAFDSSGSQATNPFGTPPPILHGNTNNSDPFHVESTLPAQGYNHSIDVSSAQSSQQVFNLLDFDPMGSPSPSNETHQPTSSGVDDDLFSFDPFASTTSQPAASSGGSQAEDAGFTSLDDPPPEKRLIDSFSLLDLGGPISSQSRHPQSSDLEVLQPLGDTLNFTQTLQDDLETFQLLEGANKVHYGIEPYSLLEGGDPHTGDGLLGSSLSPQIGEEVNDELSSVTQGSNPFANVEVTSLDDLKQELATEFSSDSLETKTDTAGSLLFDFGGGLQQDAAPDEMENQFSKESHSSQPPQDGMEEFQSVAATSEVHDEIVSNSDNEGGGILDDDQIKTSPQISEDVHDKLSSVPQGSNPFANVEVTSLDDLKQEPRTEFSSDTLETKTDTAGSLLFDFGGGMQQDVIPEGTENQFSKESHPGQPPQDDLVAFQSVTATTEVDDGIVSDGDNEGGGIHDGDQLKTSSEIIEDVSEELPFVSQGSNPFANVEVTSSFDHVKQEPMTEFSTDTLETKTDSAGSLLFDFGGLQLDAAPEEMEYQFAEESRATQPPQDGMGAFQSVAATTEVQDGIVSNSDDEESGIRDDDQVKTSPQISDDVSDEFSSVSQESNPFAKTEVNTSLHGAKQDQTVEDSSISSEIKKDTTGSLLFEFGGNASCDADIHDDDDQIKTSPQIIEDVSDKLSSAPEGSNLFADVEVNTSLQDARQDQTVKFSWDSSETKKDTAGPLLFGFGGDLAHDAGQGDNEKQFAEESHPMQPLQDDVVLLKPLEGTSPMHDVNNVNEDGEIRTSSPQIGGEVTGELFFVSQGSDPFVSGDANSSPEDVKLDQMIELPTDSLKTENKTNRSDLFDLMGDLPQNSVPEDEEKQVAEGSHPMQPLQDDLVVIQTEDANHVHDGIASDSFTDADDIHADNDQRKTLSPQISEELNAELFVVPRENNPFVSAETDTFSENDQNDQGVDFSTDTSDSKNDTAGSVLFDVTVDNPQVAFPEEKEKLSPEKIEVAPIVVLNLDDNEENDIQKSDLSEGVSDDKSFEDRSSQHQPDMTLEEPVETAVDVDKLHAGSDFAAAFRSDGEDAFTDNATRMLQEPKSVTGNLNIIVEEGEDIEAVLSGSVDVHTMNGDTFLERGNNNLNNNNWDILESEAVEAKTEKDSVPVHPFDTKELYGTERYYTNPIKMENVRDYSAPLTPNNSFGDVADVVTSTPQLDESELSEKVEELHRSRSQSLVEGEMEATNNLEDKENELRMELSEKLEEYQGEESYVQDRSKDNDDNFTGIVFNFDQEHEDFERNEEDISGGENPEESGDESAIEGVIKAENVNLSFLSARPNEEASEMDGDDKEEDAEAGKVPSEQTEDGKETDSEDGDDMRVSLTTDVGREENDLRVQHDLVGSEEEEVNGESFRKGSTGMDLDGLDSESDESDADQKASYQEETKEEIDEDKGKDNKTAQQDIEIKDGVMDMKLETDKSQPDENIEEMDDNAIKELAYGKDRQFCQDDGEHDVGLPGQHDFTESKDGDRVGEDVDNEGNPFDRNDDIEKNEDEGKEHGDKGITEDEEKMRDSLDEGDEVLSKSSESKEDYSSNQLDALNEMQSDSQDESASEKILSVETTDLDLPVFDSMGLQEPAQSDDDLVVADTGDMIEGDESEREKGGLLQLKVHLPEETFQNSSLEGTQEEVDKALMDSPEVHDVKPELLLSDGQSVEQGMTKEMEGVTLTEQEGFEAEVSELKLDFETLSSMDLKEDEKQPSDSVQVNEADVEVGFTSQDVVNDSMVEQQLDGKQFESNEEMKNQEDVWDDLNVQKSEETESETVTHLSVGFQQDTGQVSPEFEETLTDVSSEDEHERDGMGSGALVVEDVKQKLLLSEIQPIDKGVSTDMEEVEKKVSDNRMDVDTLASGDPPLVEGKEETEGVWAGTEVTNSFETVPEVNEVVEKGFSESVQFSKPAVDLRFAFDDNFESQVEEQLFDRRKFEPGQEMNDQEDLAGFNSEKTERMANDAFGDVSFGIPEYESQVDNQEFGKTLAGLPSEDEDGVIDRGTDIPEQEDDVRQRLLISEFDGTDQLVTPEVVKVEPEEISDERTSEDEDTTGSEEEVGADATEVAYETLPDAQDGDEKESGVIVERKIDGQEYLNMELDLNLGILSAMEEDSAVDQVVTEEITCEIKAVADLNTSPPTTDVQEEEVEMPSVSDVHVIESGADLRLSPQDEMQSQADEQPLDKKKFELFPERAETEFSSEKDEVAESESGVNVLGGFQDDGKQQVIEGQVDLAVIGNMKQELVPLELESSDQLVIMETEEVQQAQDSDVKVNREIRGSEGIWGEVENLPITQVVEVKMGFEDSFVFNEPFVDVKGMSDMGTNSQGDKQTFHSDQLQSREGMKDQADPWDGFDSERAKEQENEAFVNLSRGLQEDTSIHSSELLVGSLVKGKQNKKKDKIDSRSQEYEAQDPESDVMSEDVLQESGKKEKKKNKKKKSENQTEISSSQVSLEGQEGTNKGRGEEGSAVSMFLPGPSDMDSGVSAAVESPLVVPVIEVSILRDINLPEFGSASWEDPEDYPPPAEGVNTPEVTQQFEIDECGNTENWSEEPLEKGVEVVNPLHFETSKEMELEKFDTLKEEEEHEGDLPEELEKEKEKVSEANIYNSETRAGEDQTYKGLNSDVSKEISSVTVPQTIGELSTIDQPVSEDIRAEVRLFTDLNASPPAIERDHHEMVSSSTDSFIVSENVEGINREYLSLGEKVDNKVLTEENDNKGMVSSNNEESFQNIADNHDLIPGIQNTHDVEACGMDSQFVTEGSNLEQVGFLNEGQSVHGEQVLDKTKEMDYDQEDIFGDSQTAPYSSKPGDIGKVDERDEILSDNLDDKGQVEKEDGDEYLPREGNEDEITAPSSNKELVENSVDKCDDVIHEDQSAHETMTVVMDEQFVTGGSNLKEENIVKMQVVANSDQTVDTQVDMLEGILQGDPRTEVHFSGPDEIGKVEQEGEGTEFLLENLDGDRQVEKKEDEEEDVDELDEDNLGETSAMVGFETSEHFIKEEKEVEESFGTVGVGERDDILLKERSTEANSSMDPGKVQNNHLVLGEVSLVLDEQNDEAHSEGEIEESETGEDRRSQDIEEYPNVENVGGEDSTATEHGTTIDQLITEEITAEIEEVSELNASPPTAEVDHNELDYSYSHQLDINEDVEKEAEHSYVVGEVTGSKDGPVKEIDMVAEHEGDLLVSSPSEFEKIEPSQFEGEHSSNLLVSVDVHREAEPADSNNVAGGDTDGDHELSELKALNTKDFFATSSETTGEDVNEDQLVLEEVVTDIQLVEDLNAHPPRVEVDHNELDFSDSYQLNFVPELGESKVEQSAASKEVINMDDGLGVGSEGKVPLAEVSDLEVTALVETERTLTNELADYSPADVIDEIPDSKICEVKTEDEVIDESSLGLNQKGDVPGEEDVILGVDREGDEIENQRVPYTGSFVDEKQASVTLEDGDNIKDDNGGEGVISESLVTVPTEESEKSDDRLESREKDREDREISEEEIQASPETSTEENLSSQKRTVIISSNFSDLEAKQFELSLKPPGSIVDEEVFSPTQSDLSESGVDMSPSHPPQTTRRERPNSLSLSDISVNSDKGAGVMLPHVDTPILSPGVESMSSMYSHEGYFISPDYEDDDTPTPVSDLKPMEEGPVDPVLKRPLSVDSELTQNVNKGWADNQSLLEAILVKQEEQSKETDQVGNLESEDDVTPVDAPHESISKEPSSDTKVALEGDVRDRERGEAEGAEEDDADNISITISRKEPPLTPPEVLSTVAEAEETRDRRDTILSEGSLGDITLEDDDEDFEDDGFDPESKGAYSGAADSPGRKRLSVGLGLDSTSVTTEMLDAEYPAVLTPSSNEMSWDDDSSVDKKNTRVDPIPEYTAKEEHEDRWRWRKVKVGDTEYTLDNKVIEPFKKVLSHGGYYGDSVNAIIVVASCYLPEKSRKDYHYVMQNLFLYVVSSLELLVAQDYMIVYFHGAAPREKIPSLGWMKRCYQMIDRRLRKNLKGLYIVHPTAWLKTVITFTRPFISAKFYRKLKFVYHLDELKNHLSMEYIYVPDEVKRFDKEKKDKGVRPTSGWLENEAKPISSISSGFPSPPYNSHSRHRRRNPYPEADQSFMPPDDEFSDIGTEGPESGQSSPRMSFSGSLGFFEDDFLAYAESHQPCSIEEYLMQQRELFERLHRETEEEYRLEDVF